MVVLHKDALGAAGGVGMEREAQGGRCRRARKAAGYGPGCRLAVHCHCREGPEGREPHASACEEPCGVVGDDDPGGGVEAASHGDLLPDVDEPH